MAPFRVLTPLVALLWLTLFLAAAEGGRAAQAIPFEYRDGLIWVKVSASGGAGASRLNFLLDSGAGASVLDLGVARRMGVELGGKARVQRVGAAAAAWKARGFQASVGGQPLSSNPLVLDLSDTSAACSRNIDGLLGEDFFRDRIVEIDFKARCLRLPARANETGACASVPLKRERNALLVPISVNGGEHQWTRLDTGCDDGLHWVDGNGGGYAFTSVQLGKERLSKVRTALHRRPIFPEEAGLLGNEVLSGYRVTIDTVNGRLLLAKA